VPAEIDAPDVILLLLAETHGHVNAFGSIVEFQLRLRGEVNEAILAINFAVLLHGLTNLGAGKDVALLKRKDCFQRVNFERQGLVRVSAYDLERAHVVALALFNRNGDIDGFAVRAAGKRNPQLVALGVEIFQNRFADADLEVSIVLIEAADTDFDVLVELLAVVSLGQNGEIRKPQRDRVRAIVAHRADNLAAAERVIAGEANVTHLDLGAFLNFENENDGVAGGDALVLRSNFGELPAVLAE